ncbi:hypothetical protein F8G51_001347, partial [Neisseria gonorrhoeae]
LIGHALPLLIPRFQCRLNLQTAFLTRPPFTGAGRAWKYPNRHSRQYRNLETRPTTPQSRNPSDNTAILKPVIPAQAEIRTPDAAGIYRK